MTESIPAEARITKNESTRKGDPIYNKPATLVIYCAANTSSLHTVGAMTNGERGPKGIDARGSGKA